MAVFVFKNLCKNLKPPGDLSLAFKGEIPGKPERHRTGEKVGQIGQIAVDIGRHLEVS